MGTTLPPNVFAWRLASTVRPTLPARSVAPITAMVLGVKIALSERRRVRRMSWARSVLGCGGSLIGGSAVGCSAVGHCCARGAVFICYSWTDSAHRTSSTDLAIAPRGELDLVRHQQDPAGA